MVENGDDLCTKVDLILSARSLADKDVFSKSDPMCVVYESTSTHALHINTLEYREVGRTETILNCLNPEWNKKIRLNYFFEMQQPIKFEIYDVDSESSKLSRHDFLGYAECCLADIVAAPNGSLLLPLRGPSEAKGGRFMATSVEVDGGQTENLFINCHGRNIGKKRWFNFVKPSPFLQFFYLSPCGSRSLIHRSEVVKESINPEWKSIELSVKQICRGFKDSEFIIECLDYHWNGNFSHKIIGSCRTTVNELVSKKADLTLFVERRKRKEGKNYKDTGKLHFLDIQLNRVYSFLDFIYAGLQLEFAVAIDFTASNGPVHSRTSLHYLDAVNLNEYELAIRAVLDICDHYNQSKCYEATGFGAKIPPSYGVSHIFPLEFNSNSNSRTVNGVNGVLNAYRNALNLIQFYGPTNFSPTINDFIHKTRQFAKDATRYQILLIITDGIITDMAKTKASIIEASSLPISIIIIGVGQENFIKMRELDSDDQLIQFDGKTARRDIVQFVPMNQFSECLQNGTNHANPVLQSHTQMLLAKEVLAEIPDQITSYMQMMSIKPLKEPNGPIYPHIHSNVETSKFIQSQIKEAIHDKSSAPPYDL